MAQFNLPPYAPPANPDDVETEIWPLIRIYKDGTIERFLGTARVPAGTDEATGVQSKDVVISEDGVEARLYVPKDVMPEKKLPLLVYYHGGGFCIDSAKCPTYHNYLNQLVSEANLVAVSVDYRLAPEHPLPAAFEDSWTALRWIASHCSGNGPEQWLNELVDYDQVFFSGDSAGGNIVHHMAVKIGSEPLPGIKLEGILPVHPFFSGVELIGNEPHLPADGTKMIEKIWTLVHPKMADLDDPFINPLNDLEAVKKIGCRRVLVFVAEKDALMARGVKYGEVLRQSGKAGLAVEVVKAEGMQHVFHLYDPDPEEAAKMMKKVVEFINGGASSTM